MTLSRPTSVAVALLILTWVVVPNGGAAAQAPILLDGVEEMDFDRPESWAMAYFASVGMMTGMGLPEPRRPGSVELAFEGGLVPSLGEEKRRVGFVGDKVEDLNRSNLFGRLRVTVGLPQRFSLTVGVTPPVEFDGVTPKLVDLALSRLVLERPSWSLAARLRGQTGTLEGDLTCPRGIAGLDDPQSNPDACLEPSRDEVTQNVLGLELVAGPRLRNERLKPYLAVSLHYLDLEFQVRARYSVFDDRTRLMTEGMTTALAIGLNWQAAERWSLAGELFATPLEVVRDPARGVQTDELVNGRALLRYRVR